MVRWLLPRGYLPAIPPSPAPFRLHTLSWTPSFHLSRASKTSDPRLISYLCTFLYPWTTQWKGFAVQRSVWQRWRTLLPRFPACSPLFPFHKVCVDVVLAPNEISNVPSCFSQETCSWPYLEKFRATFLSLSSSREIGTFFLLSSDSQQELLSRRLSTHCLDLRPAPLRSLFPRSCHSRVSLTISSLFTSLWPARGQPITRSWWTKFWH